MSSRDGVFTYALIVLVPFKTSDRNYESQATEVNHKRTYVIDAPEGMVTVPVALPARPLTLHVMSFELTSVTGLLLGGKRRYLYWPWST